MKLQALYETVLAKRQDKSGVGLAALHDIVRTVVIEMGFEIDAAGEICDPRPRPDPMPQNSVVWRGKQRRGRR